MDVKHNKITTIFTQLGIFALYEDLTDGNEAGFFSVSSQPRIFSPQGGGFNSRTAISFELGQATNVTVKIYNPAGRLVCTLKEGEQMPYGDNVVYWDGRDANGNYCTSGMYIVTIQAEGMMATKPVVITNNH